MYFSRFQFNPVRRGAQRLMSSPHALHAAVLAGFPDASPTDTGRVLWRLDNARHSAMLYIVSPAQPDLTHLAEQGGWPQLPDSWESRSYDRLLDRITDGQQYRFRLTANPVRSTRSQPGERGKPHGHLTIPQQERWLLDREQQHGFAVTPVDCGGHDMVVRDRKLLTFRRRDTQVTLRVVTYEGALTVTDRDRFVRALSLGIGRAKGYGCGLLTITATR